VLLLCQRVNPISKTHLFNLPKADEWLKCILNTVPEHYIPNVYMCAAHFVESSLFSVAFVSSLFCKTVHRSLGQLTVVL